MINFSDMLFGSFAVSETKYVHLICQLAFSAPFPGEKTFALKLKPSMAWPVLGSSEADIKNAKASKQCVQESVQDLNQATWLPYHKPKAQPFRVVTSTARSNHPKPPMGCPPISAIYPN